MLSEALLSGASPQLRNMATVGGNIMQRTRCLYFRDPELPCNKREPNTGCGALDGFNRMHAVLGTSAKCIATHPSDMCVALVALDAIVHIEGAAGQRSVPLLDFHLLPGDTPERETVLQHGELITAVEIPDLPFARRSTYLKVRDRASYEFALTSAAVAVEVKEGKIHAARVALGGVGTKPWRAHGAERALVGSAPRESVYRQAAEAALADAKPREQNKFKIELAKETIVRALEQVEALP
jgi:xanthine dehydrogenase YagS FAD-binding subunit